MVVIKVKENRNDDMNDYFPDWIENSNITTDNTVKLCNIVEKSAFLNTTEKHIEFVEKDENELEKKEAKTKKYNTKNKLDKSKDCE